MIALDGNAKTITLSGATTFAAGLIYSAAKDWEALVANMQFVSPMTAEGKATLGGGVYTDAIYKLASGWKLQPSGYAAGTQITVSGTLITDDASVRTLPALGSEVTWLFQVASGATVVSVSGGSGLSSEEHTKLMAIPEVAPDNAGIAAIRASLPPRVRRGVAIALDVFLQTTAGQAALGKAVAAQIGMVPLETPVVEKGAGFYTVRWTAQEMDADQVPTLLTAAGCKPLAFTLVTQ